MGYLGYLQVRCLSDSGKPSPCKCPFVACFALSVLTCTPFVLRLCFGGT